jgi:hypothetical protein
MGILRFVVFGVFFVCALHLVFAEKEIDSSKHHKKDHNPLFAPEYFGVIMPIMWGSSIFQLNLPQIANGTANRPSSLPTMIKVSVPVLSFLYMF